MGNLESRTEETTTEKGLSPIDEDGLSPIYLGDRSVFCVGDVHGDPHALAMTLSMTGCARVPEAVFSETGRCPHAPHVPLDGVRWRKGCADVVIFLGDLLDNRRMDGDAPLGVCGTPRTQFAMLDLLVRLKGEARRHGGDVVLVLGNHDVANAMDHRGTGREGVAQMFCKAYAAQVQDAGDGEYAVCGPDGFTERHRQNVLWRLEALSGLAVLRRVVGRNESVLCVHGGVSVALPRIMGLVRGDVAGNMARVNGAFARALRGDGAARRLVLGPDAERLPTWCRPTYVEDGEAMQAYFGTTRLVKGHDVQMQGGNCNVRSLPQPAKGTFASHELCRLDVGMSRCFGLYRGGLVPFTVLRLHEQGGAVRRELIERPTPLGTNNEYS